jgi:hypothetical protein
VKRSGLQRKTGPKSKSERGRMPMIKICEQCGVQYSCERARSRFCSLKCSGLSSSPLRGHKIVCAECGCLFYAKPSQIARGRKYCSRACLFAKDRRPPAALKAMAERFSVERCGPGNPAWKGRDTEGSIYRVFNVRLKGEHCCRNCGSGGMLHLHHIVPRSMCKSARRDLRNGVPLCPSCHSRWHACSITIYRDIFTAEEWAYVSSLRLLGQNIETWLDRRYPKLVPESEQEAEA